jgi:threonine aldolase
MIDLRSDTKTQPTAEMRRAMATATVGDEQLGEDPTVHVLEGRAAALLGHERAIFLPSGTMANLIALLLHVGRAGDEVVLASETHVLRSEAGGGAALAGAVFRPLASDDGVLTPEQLADAVRPDDIGAPRTRLLVAEQSTNWTGGRLWSVDALDAILDAAADLALRTHLDGARLLNAAVALDVEPDRLARRFDTVMLDFTKGLGAPLGAVLALPAALEPAARRFKRMLGGALRQAGICAAACLHGLDHHVARLAEDHANARRLADRLAALDGLDVVRRPVTNIVLAETPDPTAFLAALRAEGVLASRAGATTVRFVTHLDVAGPAADRAADAAQRALDRTATTVEA